MYRIRTKIGNITVTTLWFPQMWQWITLRRVTDDNGKVTVTSALAPNEFEAGQLHLSYCKV